jgi:hypothetical protein
MPAGEVGRLAFCTSGEMLASPCFASPDFGAEAGAELILLVFHAVVFAAVSLAAVYAIMLLRRESSRERRRGVWLASCLAAGILGTWAAWRHFHGEPHYNLERLLAGDDQVEVFSLAITGQRQSLELSDPASMRYLTAAFRSATKTGFFPMYIGNTYHADVRMGPAGSERLGLEVPEEADGLTVFPNDTPGDAVYYWVPLPGPMPPAVSAALGRMRKPPPRDPDRK